MYGQVDSSQWIAGVAEREWPLWKRFGEDDKEYIAGRYEAIRDWLIAERNTKLVVQYERQWQQAYGNLSYMSAVLEEMQSNG